MLPAPHAAPASDPATDPATPPQGRDPRLRTRRVVLLVFLILGLSTVIVYIALLKRAEGDYLLHPQFGFTTRLHIDGYPRWTDGYNMVSSAFSFYLVGPGGVEFRTYPSVSSMIRRFGADPLSRGSIAPIHGAPGAFLVRGDAGGDYTVVAERFEPGSLGRFVTAIPPHSGKRPAEVLAAARELHARYPDRLTVKYWLIAALFQAGDHVEAERLLAAWSVDFTRERNPRGPWLRQLLENDRIATTDAARATRETFDRNVGGARPGALDLEHLVAWVAELGEDDVPRYPSLYPWIEDDKAWLSRGKLLRVQTMLLLLDGRRDEARRLLLGSLHVSRSTHPPVDSLFALLSTSASLQAIKAASACYLDGEWSAAELQATWEEVEALWTSMPRYDDPGILRCFAPEFDDLDSIDGAAAEGPGSTGLDLGRVAPSLRFAEARRELFREGLRARHYREVNGAWPAIGDDSSLDGLLLAAAAPPLDPCEKPPRLLRARETTEALILWSIGPDGADDGGLLEYDPANGSRSAGDLLLELDNEPRYRWPRTPDHEYADRAEFESRYPKGLPPDPFAKLADARLKLAADGTDLVWSFGPDEDELFHDNHVEPEGEVDVLYDPTNGATSRGDLYRKLNFRAPPASAAPPPPVAGPMPSPFLPPPPAP